MVQVKLPDMELIVNLGDWPLNKRDRQPTFPVFSWCGSENTRDIIWPTWDLMKATIMGMDRWVGHGQVGMAWTGGWGMGQVGMTWTGGWGLDRWA